MYDTDYQTQYRQKNQERIKAYKAQYYRENKERIQAQNAQRYQENQEEIKARARRYYLEAKDRRREEIKARRVRYLAGNRERINATNARSMALRRGRNKKHVERLKRDNPCVDCGDTHPPHVMDYDHLPGTDKRFDVSKSNHSIETLQAEIDKCELVCANCHAARTYYRRDGEKSDRREALAPIRELKEAQPCMDCEVHHPFYVMQYDHRPGEKKEFAIGSPGGRGIPKILDEIKKCDLVCTNCHRRRTISRLSALE